MRADSQTGSADAPAFERRVDAATLNDLALLNPGQNTVEFCGVPGTMVGVGRYTLFLQSPFEFV